MASIRKRRLPSGKTVWQLDYKDGAGKRHRHEFTEKKSAEKRFAQIVEEERQAKPAPSILTDVTVEKFSELWLDIIEPTIASNTYKSYAQILKLYILPIIGNELMLAIHEGTIGTLLTSWTTRGKSPNTVRLIRACLSAMFADAADTSSHYTYLSATPSHSLADDDTAEPNASARKLKGREGSEC